MLNTQLIQEIANFLRTHPEAYDQSQWCGTACCIAGRAALMQGYVWDADTFSLLNKEGRRADTSGVASQALGVPYNTYLFSAWPEMYWPSPYRERWEATLHQMDGETREADRANIAADFLEHIIALGRIPGDVIEDGNDDTYVEE
jgi:hypothetical protein